MKNIRDIDQKALAIAHSWIGTPYRHQAARKHIGCDCLGLLRGMWFELYGVQAEQPEPYSIDWAEHVGPKEPMLDAAYRHCGDQIKLNNMHVGAILLFRWNPNAAIKHIGILSKSDRFIHAYEGKSVVESALVPAWRRRIAAAFEFPQI